MRESSLEVLRMRPPTPVSLQPTAIRLSPPPRRPLWQPVSWTWLTPPPPLASSAGTSVVVHVPRTTTSTTQIRPVSPPAVILEVLQDALSDLFQQAILYIKRTYQPHVIKRKRAGGFLVRMRTAKGRKLLNGRRLKGRWRLDIGIKK